jgi:hypothetical protein
MAKNSCNKNAEMATPSFQREAISFPIEIPGLGNDSHGKKRANRHLQSSFLVKRLYLEFFLHR